MGSQDDNRTELGSLLRRLITEKKKYKYQNQFAATPKVQVDQDMFSRIMTGVGGRRPLGAAAHPENLRKITEGLISDEPDHPAAIDSELDVEAILKAVDQTAPRYFGDKDCKLWWSQGRQWIKNYAMQALKEQGKAKQQISQEEANKAQEAASPLSDNGKLLSDEEFLEELKKLLGRWKR